MKGIRFYEEFHNARKTKSCGNVFAAFIENGPRFVTSGGKMQAMYDGLGGAYDYNNSPVCSTSASLDYLRTRCKRISEKKAREVHPQMFARLDRN